MLSNKDQVALAIKHLGLYKAFMSAGTAFNSLAFRVVVGVLGNLPMEAVAIVHGIEFTLNALLEVPFGYLGDRFGRIKASVVGLVAVMINLVCIYLALIVDDSTSKIALLVIAGFLLGIGKPFISGSIEAFYQDVVEKYSKNSYELGKLAERSFSNSLAFGKWIPIFGVIASFATLYLLHTLGVIEQVFLIGTSIYAYVIYRVIADVKRFNTPQLPQILVGTKKVLSKFFKSRDVITAILLETLGYVSLACVAGFLLISSLRNFDSSNLSFWVTLASGALGIATGTLISGYLSMQLLKRTNENLYLKICLFGQFVIASAMYTLVSNTTNLVYLQISLFLYFAGFYFFYNSKCAVLTNTVLGNIDEKFKATAISLLSVPGFLAVGIYSAYLAYFRNGIPSLRELFITVSLVSGLSFLITIFSRFGRNKESKTASAYLLSNEPKTTELGHFEKRAKRVKSLDIKFKNFATSIGLLFIVGSIAVILCFLSIAAYFEQTSSAKTYLSNISTAIKPKLMVGDKMELISELHNLRSQNEELQALILDFAEGEDPKSFKSEYEELPSYRKSSFSNFINPFHRYWVEQLPLETSSKKVDLIVVLSKQKISTNLIVSFIIIGIFSIVAVVLFLLRYKKMRDSIVKPLTDLTKIVEGWNYINTPNDVAPYKPLSDILEVDGLYRALLDKRVELSITSQKLEKTKAKQVKAEAIALTAKMLTHDLQKPFSEIQAFESAIKTTSIGELESILPEFLDNLKRNRELVQNHLQDMLNLGDKIKIDPVQTRFATVIDEFLRDYITKDSVIINAELDTALLASLDSFQMKRAIGNILDNAVTSMNSEGQIDVTLKKVKGRAVLQIANTGPIIEEKKLSRIFEPYFSESEKGTGLGLSIVKQIVETHDGAITCRSDSKEGTVFTIALKAIEDRNIVSLDTYKSKKTEKVLICDDSVIIRLELKNKLKAIDVDLHIVEAKDSTSALHQAEHESFDLVIMDIDLGPNSKCGIETAEILSKKFLETKIILHSNKHPDLYKDCDFKFYPKPIKKKSLRRLISDTNTKDMV